MHYWCSCVLLCREALPLAKKYHIMCILSKYCYEYINIVLYVKNITYNIRIKLMQDQKKRAPERGTFTREKRRVRLFFCRRRICKTAVIKHLFGIKYN